MRIPFPTAGLVDGAPSSEQPIKTSHLLRNVRPFDIQEERLTGGQRPGTTKQYSTHCGYVAPTSHPIIIMAQVTSTFIPPVAP